MARRPSRKAPGVTGGMVNFNGFHGDRNSKWRFPQMEGGSPKWLVYSRKPYSSG